MPRMDLTFALTLLLFPCACATAPAEPAGTLDRITKLERENAELRSRIDLLSEKVWELTPHIDPGIVDGPRIDGHVLDVKRDLNLVVLDKGKRDDVVVGFVFDVYSGAKYKGQVRITDVQERMCSGTILSEPSPIAPGDSATTGL